MDYQFENLGDERFQEFCSCLISKEFPNMQAFPVGQPDGGRDSIVYNMNSTKKDFIVFQVKFVRNPSEEKDIHKWLLKIIQEEVDKINKLIPKGAVSYYLITNIKGTAHSETGSKDKLDKILSENISIPSICWWRDDISRLFEKDPLFMWSFPQILNGQDILNSILFEQLHENKTRRESVINAYLSDQYEMDNEVKFKQIDLQNKLFNLFTDVPIRIKKYNEKNKLLKQTLSSIDYGFNRRFFINDEIFWEESNTGASEFLLHSRVQSEIERILLEGGPGQGKSTIVQYICQVHRARLLNKVVDLDSLPQKIRHTPIRLPLKIDLRDLAAWVENKNPYQDSLNEEYFKLNWKNTLEAFIVAHIYYHSSIEHFNSYDFIEVCKHSPVLLVFDGFDEIANLKIRSEVIDLINKGITRIAANSLSIQVIITSRPAAFSDSVGFSTDHYPHFELADITNSIINEYLEKWIKASKLTSRDASELKKLMKEKLEMPHLKDLAKSPMQLAIFISLLRTKGQSLPNKRTALYDSYIDLFFDRESEKSNLIRDKRDLIIDIHQYLAWLLHSEAELFKNSGSIHINELNLRLKEYLAKEGHDTSIADQLFDVMKERVCALISRVQGTFEFEVQPLREYFCAKYLYKSAPHSSAGDVKKGTKPDRLHSILRNFYWQNVVRFFTGCADAGELDMIIQELKELQEDPILKYTNYPRVITSQILSDYVFTQKPLKMKEVVKIIVNGINIGNIINQDRRFPSNEPLLLPNECGRMEIIKECFDQLIKFPSNDYANELIGIINNNPFDTLETWIELSQTLSGSQLTKWFEYAYKLQIIHNLSKTQITNVFEEGDAVQKKIRLQYVINGNRFDVINHNKEMKHLTLSSLLDNELAVVFRRSQEYSLAFLGAIFHPFILVHIFQQENLNRSFGSFLSVYFDRSEKDFLITFPVEDDVDQKVEELLETVKPMLEWPIAKFRNTIEPWSKIIEKSRSIFNDHWIFYLIATISGGIKSKEELPDVFIDLHDNSLDLCKRARTARLKSGNIKFWERQLSAHNEMLFTLLLLFTWATPKTIIALSAIIDELIQKLEDSEFLKLCRSLQHTIHSSHLTRTQGVFVEDWLKNNKLTSRFMYLFSLRLDDSARSEFVFKHMKDQYNDIAQVREMRFRYAMEHYLNYPDNTLLLSKIKEYYENINRYDERLYFRAFHHSEMIKIPYEIAKKIMEDCKNYPILISLLAEKACRLYSNEHQKPVGETAKNEHWFE